jgi:hypothetical protein
MNEIWHLGLCGLLLCGSACSGGTDGDSPPGPTAPDPGKAGLHWENGKLTFRTEPFSVAPGNTTDRTITYGESSFDAMCFLGIFWVGSPTNCVVF